MKENPTPLFQWASGKQKHWYLTKYIQCLSVFMRWSSNVVGYDRSSLRYIIYSGKTKPIKKDTATTHSCSSIPNKNCLYLSPVKSQNISCNAILKRATDAPYTANTVTATNAAMVVLSVSIGCALKMREKLGPTIAAVPRV